MAKRMRTNYKPVLKLTETFKELKQTGVSNETSLNSDDSIYWLVRKTKWIAPSMKKVKFIKTSKEFQIPRDLKEKIQKDYIEYVRETGPSNIEEDDKLVAQLPREFLEVDLYLKEMNSGTLNHNTIFRAPRGGGLVDLAESVLGEKGSFLCTIHSSRPTVSGRRAG